MATASRSRPVFDALAIDLVSVRPTENQDAVTFAECKFIVSFGLILCVVTTLPYLVGHFVSYPGTAFTGIIEHSADTNNYLSYANQAAAGKWLFRNQMTGEPHGDVFFNLEWLLIGKIAALLHVSLAMGLSILRLFCLLLMSYGVYWLSAFSLKTIFARRVAMVAIMAGGGFGWMAALHLLHIRIDSSYFLDLTAALQFPFYWALKLPHFLVSETFVVMGLCFFLRAETRHSVADYVAAGACYLASGACRPYDMLFLMCATGLYLAIDCRARLNWDLLRRGLPISICVPLLGYEFWIFKIHPVFRWWSLPGLPPPSPWLLALSFGLSFLLFVAALWRWKTMNLHGAPALMACCLGLSVLFVYTYRFAHFSFQFATNIVVPLVMLGLIALEGFITRWREKRWGTALIIGLLVVNSLTSVALTGQAIVLAAKGDFRINQQQLEAFSWLDRHSQPNDLVLANYEISNHLPQYTHNAAFCGYGNTVQYAHKSQAQLAFFRDNASAEFRAELLTQNGIRFLFATPEEAGRLRSAGQRLPLTEIYRNDAAVVYRVIHDKH
jgi:hypothetical protein